jgi:hypothetical protein
MASKSTKSNASRDFKFGGDVYHITVRSFDKDLGHVTAEWWRASDRQAGRLGYGVVSADIAIKLAEQAICNPTPPAATEPSRRHTFRPPLP